MVFFIGLMILALLLGMIITIALNERYSRAVASIVSLIVLIIIFAMLANSISTGTVSLTESYVYYIQALNITLVLQLTPIALALLVMTGIVSFVTIFAGNVEKQSPRSANALLLLFEISAIGLFTSANLLLFFIFWDIGIIALFFMIYLFGSSARKRAAIKFLMYEILASTLLFLGIMLIYFHTGIDSFSISYITSHAALINPAMQTLIFLLLLGAFLINMPLFPAHLWLPDAHTEASTQGSMVLSGILTKFGGYGMLLLFSMLPISANYSIDLAFLAGISAFYSAFVLMRQHDIKRVVAYTTIVEMSIIMLGIASMNTFGTYGAAFGMLAHGITIAMLFLAAGSVGHIFAERDIRLFKGAVANAASAAYTFLIGTFATTGVPFTAAFIADILIFIGAENAFGPIGIAPLAALLLTGAYMYYVLNKAFFAAREPSKNVNYIGLSQKIGFALLMFFIIAFGALPSLLLHLFQAG